MSVSVLLVETRPDRSRELMLALESAGFSLLGIVSEGEDIHDAVRSLKPDAIVIDADSPSRDTLEGLGMVGSRFPRPVLMLSGAADTDLVREMAGLGISTYAVDGLSGPLLRTLIEVTIAQFQRERSLSNALSDAQRQLSERRLIDRAKCSLMESQGLTEDEAYHRMRRTAMSRGIKIVELAAEVMGSRA